MAEAADFFVSYTDPDRAWAEWIAWQLEAEGYQVIVQAWDFTPGKSWAYEMQKATSTAERVVAVLSAAYLESEHGEAEWEVFQAKDPLGKRGLLLPVRVHMVDPPGLLKTRIYVDLVDKEAVSARAALLAAARGARGKPTAEPEFPSRQRQAPSITEAPRFPGELPPVWNVPSHPNPFFTGRELLLANLHERLTAPEVASRRVVLTGLGGVGKTQLAVEYAYRRRADYDLVWWVRGEQPTSLRGKQPTSLAGDYAALADQPLLANDLRLREGAPQTSVVAAVRVWLERHRRWLLVLDDVEDPRAVADLLPRSATSHVLLTSQAETGWESLADPLPVQVLAPTDAAGFLLARTGEQGPAAKAAATTLATTLGGLPLALEQAGAYVAATGTVTLAEYVKLFATRALELLQRGQPLGYQHTVATAWSLALQSLQETEPAAVDLLTLATYLAPDDLPQPLLIAHHDQLSEPLATIASDPLALADAIAALRRYSLVRVVRDGLFFHRLLETVVQAALDLKTEQRWATAAIRLIFASFPRRIGEISEWPESDRLLPHALAVAEHGERLEVEPGKWLWLLNQVASYLGNRGQYRQASQLAEQTLAGCRRLLGEDHPNTLTSMNNLATNRQALGDLQGAHELHEQALAARRRGLGKDHPDTLGSMNNLAETRWALGDLQGAHELHEQALAARRQVLGENHPDTLRSMNNLAVSRWDLDDLDGAHELHEQALAAYRQVLGEDHPDTLQLMTNLAVSRRKLGDLQGAHELFEQALTARRQALGEDHPDTLQSMSNLAVSRAALGDLQGALEVHENVLAARRRVLGDDHPETLHSTNNLALTREALGDLQGARQLHEQALDGRRRVLGDDHPDTLQSMNKLAAIRRALGEL